jgi:hypothetical protein
LGLREVNKKKVNICESRFRLKEFMEAETKKIGKEKINITSINGKKRNGYNIDWNSPRPPGIDIENL